MNEELEENCFEEREVEIECKCNHGKKCRRKLKIIESAEDEFSILVANKDGYYLVESDFVIKKERLKEILNKFENKSKEL